MLLYTKLADHNKYLESLEEYQANVVNRFVYLEQPNEGIAYFRVSDDIHGITDPLEFAKRVIENSNRGDRSLKRVTPVQYFDETAALLNEFRKKWGDFYVQGIVNWAADKGESDIITGFRRFADHLFFKALEARTPLDPSKQPKLFQDDSGAFTVANTERSADDRVYKSHRWIKQYYTENPSAITYDVLPFIVTRAETGLALILINLHVEVLLSILRERINRSDLTQDEKQKAINRAVSRIAVTGEKYKTATIPVGEAIRFAAYPIEAQTENQKGDHRYKTSEIILSPNGKLANLVHFRSDDALEKEAYRTGKIQFFPIDKPRSGNHKPAKRKGTFAKIISSTDPNEDPRLNGNDRFWLDMVVSMIEENKAAITKNKKFEITESHLLRQAGIKRETIDKSMQPTINEMARSIWKMAKETHIGIKQGVYDPANTEGAARVIDDTLIVGYINGEFHIRFFDDGTEGFKIVINTDNPYSVIPAWEDAETAGRVLRFGREWLEFPDIKDKRGRVIVQGIKGIKLDHKKIAYYIARRLKEAGTSNTIKLETLFRDMGIEATGARKTRLTTMLGRMARYWKQAGMIQDYDLDTIGKKALTITKKPEKRLPKEKAGLKKPIT